MGSNTTVIVIVVILAGHFLFGIGYLLYKMFGADPKEKK